MMVLKTSCLCCLMIALIAACKKNDGAASAEKELLTEWYNKNTAANDISFNDMKPIWKSAIVSEQPNQVEVYEVALSNPKNVYQRLSNNITNEEAHLRNNIRLLIFKDKENGKIISGCYMSILNEGQEIQNLSEIHYKQAKNFVGKIMFFNMDGKLENGWEYDNGKIIKRINGSLEGYYAGRKNTLSDLKSPALSGTSRSALNKLMIYIPPACAFPQPDYQTSCVGVDGYMECSTYLAGYFCVDQTSGGGGEGSYNPGNPPPTGGGGGNSPNPVNRDTTMQADFYKNAKAMCALAKLMENNYFKTTLNNFIGAAKPIDLTFKLENITQEPGFITMGNTIPNPRSWSSTNIDVTIAANVIDSLPSISVALTLLHEGIHAEIFRKLLSIHGPSNLNARNFPSLFNLWVGSREWEGFSHEFMANYYVNTMANAIKEYDNSKFGVEYYQALAWTGLKGTEYYNDVTKVSAVKKNEIDSLSKIVLKGRSKQNCNDL
jgi:hypothetical protein